MTTEADNPLELPHFDPVISRFNRGLSAVYTDNRYFIFDPFYENDGQAVVSTFLKLGTSVYRCSALNDDFLSSDDILATVNIRSLPDILATVAFELAFKEHLEAFKCLFGADLSVCEPVSGFNASYSFVFRLVKGDSVIPVRLDFPDEYAVDALFNLIDNLPAVTNVNLLSSLSCSLGFDVGYMFLRTEALRDLTEGDILLPSVFLLDSGVLSARLGRECLIFDYADGNAVFKGTRNYILERSRDTTMSDTTTDNTNVDSSQLQDFDSSGSVKPTGETVNISDLEFEVAFELERKVMSVSDLSSMKVGDVVPLTCDKKSPVAIKINGKGVGTGRMVDLGSQIGVQVLDIKS